MVSSLCISVLVGLAVAGPGLANPSRPRADAVGIVWHGEATAPSPIRQRLVDTLIDAAQPVGGSEVGPVLVEHADQRARVAVAVAVPRAEADQSVRLVQGVADATNRFRGGDPVAAEAAAQGILAALDADPALPGAAGLAFAAQMLRVQIAWAAGDETAARELSRHAIALDANAELSTRQVPPGLAALYEEVRQSILLAQDDWAPITFEVDVQSGPIVIEIDGRPGQRILPPGRHCVVVRTMGRPA